ncbi:MAG: hypothetical protein ABIT38_15000 [Gemmatimonadaceae bacterium]
MDGVFDEILVSIRSASIVSSTITSRGALMIAQHLLRQAFLAVALSAIAFSGTTAQEPSKRRTPLCTSAPAAPTSARGVIAPEIEIVIGYRLSPGDVKGRVAKITLDG